MRISAIVENTCQVDLPTEHGLSLYIQLDSGENILFDMGQGKLFAENAKRIELNINKVDVAVISHGHYDHGGGLEYFLKQNKHANVYIHQDAFQPHYSLRETGLKYIGLDNKLKDSKQIIFGNDIPVDTNMHCWRVNSPLRVRGVPSKRG